MASKLNEAHVGTQTFCVPMANMTTRERVNSAIAMWPTWSRCGRAAASDAEAPSSSLGGDSLHCHVCRFISRLARGCRVNSHKQHRRGYHRRTLFTACIVVHSKVAFPISRFPRIPVFFHIFICRDFFTEKSPDITLYNCVSDLWYLLRYVPVQFLSLLLRTINIVKVIERWVINSLVGNIWGSRSKETRNRKLFLNSLNTISPNFIESELLNTTERSQYCYRL